MKKIALLSCACALCCGLFGCDKEQKVTTPNVNSENLMTVEARWQSESQDKAAVAAGENLECRYVMIKKVGGDFVRHESSSKGTKCVWADLKNNTKRGASVPADVVNEIVSIAMDGSSAESVQAKRDCVAFNVQTNARKAGFLDCTIKDPKRSVSGEDAAAQALTRVIGF